MATSGAAFVRPQCVPGARRRRRRRRYRCRLRGSIAGASRTRRGRKHRHDIRWDAPRGVIRQQRGRRPTPCRTGDRWGWRVGLSQGERRWGRQGWMTKGEKFPELIQMRRNKDWEAKTPKKKRIKKKT